MIAEFFPELQIRLQMQAIAATVDSLQFHIRLCQLLAKSGDMRIHRAFAWKILAPNKLIQCISVDHLA